MVQLIYIGVGPSVSVSLAFGRSGRLEQWNEFLVLALSRNITSTPTAEALRSFMIPRARNGNSL